MSKEYKTKAELINEISCLNQRIRELEEAGSTCKQEQEVLQRFNNISSLLLNNSVVGIAFVRHRTFEWVNPRLSQMLGLPSHRIQGAGTRIIYASDEACEDTGRRAYTALNRGEWFDFEIVMPHADGTNFLGRIIGKALDPKLPQEGSVWIFEDITERKQGEAALRESETKYRSLVDNSYDLIWTLTADGVFTYVSPSWQRTLGHEPSYMIGKPFQPFVHPDEVAICEAYLQEAIQAGRQMPGPEYRVKHLDGTWRWHAASGTPVFSPDGSFISFVGISRDITERKQVEEALCASEDRYHAMFEQAGDGVFLLDTRGKIISVNETFARMHGFGVADMLRMGLAGLSVEGTAHVPDRIRRIMAGETMNFEVEHIHREGHTFPLAVTANLITAGGEQLILAVHRDITERKKAEQALLESEIAARRLAQESELIAEIGRIISSTLNLEEVYERFAEKVRAAIPFNRLTVNVINIKDQTRTIRYVKGDGSWEDHHRAPIPLAGTRAELVLRTKSSLLINSRNEKELLKNHPGILSRRSEARSAMLIPLISEDEIFGILNFQSAQMDTYAENDLRLAERVGSQIAGAIANAQLFLERRQAEADLRESQRRLSDIIEFLPDATLVVDKRGKVIAWNRALEAMTGVRAGEMLGKGNYEYALPFYGKRRPLLIDLALHPDPDREKDYTAIQRTGDIIFGEAYTPNLSPGNVHLSASASVLRTSGGEIIAAIECIRNNTERKLLESQLQQAQKMESIGTLAGGIAHDFNNILSAIMGYTDMALTDPKVEGRLRRYLEQVYKGGERASDLVKQILAFSRQNDRNPRPLRVSPIIKEALKLLRATLPTTITISQDIQSDGDTVLADPTQIHQVLMNLCTNAAHAMRERKGELKVSLAPVEVKADDTSISHHHPNPGMYLKLTVSDTGNGIAPEIMDRIFDPFFTTKKPGEGTGMGLAVVHGIVKSCQGRITLESEPGKGTAFHLYLPLLQENEEKRETETAGHLPEGKERILFVDDEEVLVQLGKDTLTGLGYEVIERTSSLEALKFFKSRPDRVDLVITDMTMPNMTGLELAQEIMHIRPGLPVIICTGFSEAVTPEKAKALGLRELVMKPIIKSQIAAAIRRALHHKD